MGPTSPTAQAMSKQITYRRKIERSSTMTPFTHKVATTGLRTMTMRAGHALIIGHRRVIAACMTTATSTRITIVVPAGVGDGSLRVWTQHGTMTGLAMGAVLIGETPGGAATMTTTTSGQMCNV